MRESEFSASPEIVNKQIQLATKLKTTSDLLLLIFPIGQAETWHIISPTFGKPKVSLLGFDVSDTLYELAQRTRELHVSSSYLEGGYDESGYFSPCYVWEVFPPQGSSFLGRFSSDCNGSIDLAGLGLAAYIPDINKPPTQKELQKLIEDGCLNIDVMTWKEPNEGFRYNFQKPGSVMMNMIEQDPVASLEVANWFLRGLLTAQEIHPEEVVIKDI